MDAIDEVKSEIETGLQQLVEYLELSAQPQALRFFEGARTQLDNVRDEADLLEFFMVLSTTAFQGFQLDPVGSMLTDRILAYAEQTAHTFSASDGQGH